MTAEEMSTLAAQGRYWWMRRDGTFYGTTEYQPTNPADFYLLDASPEWIAQWEGDWPKAVEVMTPLFPRLDPYREEF
ncbi:MAG TPA: hypothetical protein PLV93_08525 [Microthrixaceae bacterium]|nr:hypothetical protein [Microthrixaceae bacterium]